MNNDPWADREDGNAAAVYEGYDSSLGMDGEKKENISEAKQKMGATAVKAAELEYANRVKQAHENVQRQIDEAKKALAERIKNATPNEEVAARTEAATDFAKKAVEIRQQMKEKVRQAKEEIDRVYEQKRIEMYIDENESLRGRIAELEAQLAEKDNRIADEVARREAIEELYQQNQEANDQKLGAYAEAVAGTNTEDADMEDADDNGDLVDMDAADGNEDVADMEDADNNGDLVDMDEADGDKNLADMDEADGDKDLTDMDEADGGENAELKPKIEVDLDSIDAILDIMNDKMDLVVDNTAVEVPDSGKSNGSEKDNQSPEKNGRRKALKERLNRIVRSKLGRVLVGVLAAAAVLGSAFTALNKSNVANNNDEAVNQQRVESQVSERKLDADIAGSGETAEAPLIEASYFVANENGEREDITENWYQEVRDDVTNPFGAETRGDGEALSADKKESKNAFGPMISDKELTGDNTGLEREYNIKFAERMAAQPELALLQGVFLGAFDGDSAPFSTFSGLKSKNENISPESLNQDVRYISTLSKEQKQEMLNAALNKTADLVKSKEMRAYTVKAGTAYHTMHFEMVTDENGESHLEIKSGKSVKNYDYEVPQVIGEDGDNAWNANDVKIRVLKAMGLIDSSLSLEDAVKSGVMNKYTVLGERNACGGQIVVVEKGTKQAKKINTTVVSENPVGKSTTPGNPDPGNPDPGNPDPGNPDPGNPDPGNPDPGNPDPNKPNPDKKTGYDTLDGAGTQMEETKQDDSGDRTDVVGDGSYEVEPEEQKQDSNLPSREENKNSTETTASDENVRYEEAQQAGGSENPANEAVGQEISVNEEEDRSGDSDEQKNRDASRRDQADAIANYLGN